MKRFFGMIPSRMGCSFQGYLKSYYFVSTNLLTTIRRINKYGTVEGKRNEGFQNR